MIATLEAPSVLKMLSHDLRWRIVSALARSDYHGHELMALLQEPQNVVSYHLRLLRESHLAQERRSAADARDVYYSLDLAKMRDLYFAAGQAIHPAMQGDSEQGDSESTPKESEDATPTTKSRVLFLCTHNSARSQMAEGILRFLAGDRVEVASAGTEVTRVHPLAIQVMKEMNIDISGQHSKHLNEFLGQHWDYAITVCDRAKESCPVFPGDPERLHWSFDDPSAVEPLEAKLEAFRRTARELLTRARVLLALIEKETRRIS